MELFQQLQVAVSEPAPFGHPYAGPTQKEAVAGVAGPGDEAGGIAHRQGIVKSACGGFFVVLRSCSTEPGGVMTAQIQTPCRGIRAQWVFRGMNIEAEYALFGAAKLGKNLLMILQDLALDGVQQVVDFLGGYPEGDMG